MQFSKWLLAATCSLVSASLIGETDANTQPMGNAKYFQGFDIDAGVGYGGVTLETKRGGIKPPSNTYYGGDGVAVQLRGGWHYGFCDIWLVGIEGYGQYNSAKTKNHFFETTTSTTATNRTFKMEWNLGLDARLGIAPFCTNLIFIYGGPDWGYYDFQYTTTGVSDHYKRFHTGGALGAGLEQRVSDHWFVKSTFDYRWYPSKTLTYSNGETQTIKPRLATALFMIGYLF